MSDGKEVKRFELDEIYPGGGTVLYRFVLASDHDRIVAELKTYASELELKIADLVLFPDQESSLKTIAELRAEVERLKSKDSELVKCLQDLTGANNQINPHLGVAAGVALMKAELTDSNKTIATQAREAEVSKAVIEKLREKLEEIRWSWENDAGRQCDNLAFEALAAIEKEGAKDEKATT